MHFLDNGTVLYWCTLLPQQLKYYSLPHPIALPVKQ
jgi:hypothetical protein